RRARGLSDHRRPVRHRAQRADTSAARRLQRETRALRCRFHWRAVQRAQTDRARLRVRTSDQATSCAAAVPVRQIAKTTDFTDFTDEESAYLKSANCRKSL